MRLFGQGFYSFVFNKTIEIIIISLVETNLNLISHAIECDIHMSPACN